MSSDKRKKVENNPKLYLSNLVKDPRLEELALSLKTPNFFSILNVSKAEIRHSNFLAWLMTPHESHNLNTVFIRWFLKEIFSSDKIQWANEFSVDSINLNEIRIFREWNNIDILIQHESFVIGIENKINSTEHSNQLLRYSKLVDKSFPKLDKGFVFLTIDGQNPEDDDDAKKYVSVGYGFVKSVIEIILSVYNHSLSERIKFYIEDYLLVLNRNIMKEHESIELAQELYRNHREAIDFIVEHIPDRLSHIREGVESAIVDEGYSLETCSKSYARFLTPKLSDMLPKTGVGGWKGQESFLFEISYREKSLSLKFVISPGNENNRQTLSELLKDLSKSKKPQGKKWLTYYSNPHKINFLSEKFDDLGEVKEFVKKVLAGNKELILEAEDRILMAKDNFEY